MRSVLPSVLPLVILVAGCSPVGPARTKSAAKPAQPKVAATPRPESPLDAVSREPVPREGTPRPEPAPREKPRAERKTAVPAAADTAMPRWKVVSVHDGDTVRCLDADNVQHKVRLVGIDAPETGQAFGTKSREHLAAIVMGRMVAVERHGEDRYGRTLGRIEADGQDVNREMVSSGMAWHYARYDHDPLLAEAEREARAAKRGLWADPHAVPPWEWRADEREQAHERRAAARP